MIKKTLQSKKRFQQRTNLLASLLPCLVPWKTAHAAVSYVEQPSRSDHQPMSILDVLNQ